MTLRASEWLLFITNLPGRNPTVRMRMWRALKAAGAGMMRDGAYVLPNSDRAHTVFEEQSVEIKEAGGLGHIVSFDATTPTQNESLVALFDRTAEYVEVIQSLKIFKNKLSESDEIDARQTLTSVTREVASIVTRDFFPGEARKQMEGALADTEAAINACFAPDEPGPVQRALKRHDARDYRGRIWATREHLWIDRVASAWLIRRCIDSKAKFLWLETVQDCPKRAVGFDFDGAEFTHVGSKVTFEVLLASFDLECDAGLVRLGALIHHLDVGGIPVAEGPGLATIMAGARKLQPDDDALLKAMTPVLDALHAGFASTARQS